MRVNCRYIISVIGINIKREENTNFENANTKHRRYGVGNKIFLIPPEWNCLERDGLCEYGSRVNWDKTLMAESEKALGSKGEVKKKKE